VVRLLIAHLLRLVAVACLTVAIVTSVITLVGLALAAVGKLELGGGYGAEDLALMWAVVLAALLAISRLAHIALGWIVDLGHPEPHS
jgi:hypothetical protein